MITSSRLRAAARAAGVHLLCSVAVAMLAAALVFGLWYPFPYRDLSGGRELFLLVVGVDVICGPLLTLVIFNPAKNRTELWRDLGLVALIQLSALSYGLWTVWDARPLFLVMEVDRFKVIAAPDVSNEAVMRLPIALQPKWTSAPRVLGIREPKDANERNQILFESVRGGRDYAERPEFYLPYEGAAALKSLSHAKPLMPFLKKYPSQRSAAQDFVDKAGLKLESIRYVPVIGRQDWIALLDDKGMIVGFLKGDGF